MKSKPLQRALLLACGFCAVLVILLSQSFYHVSDQAFKAKTEKSKDKTEVAIHAPSDVAAQGQSVELSEQQPAQLEELVLEDHKNERLVFVQKTTLKFFKTLFRAIISPNAP